MATLASTIVARCAGLLTDSGYKRWSEAELLDYLNEGLQAMVRRQPNLFATVADVTLVSGVKQTLPSGGVVLVDIKKAFAAGGAFYWVPRRVDLDALKLFAAKWPASSSGPVRQWAYEPDVNPIVYWVDPPQPQPAYAVQIEYAVAPAPVTSPDPLPTPPRYDDALVDYVLGRAYEKDATYAGQDGRAARHMKAFEEKTGGSAAGSG